MSPELPLMAEWVRSAEPSGMSIGLPPDPSAGKPVPVRVSRSSRSQLATLRSLNPGKTASLQAGVSIGQVFRQQRSTSEGTVHRGGSVLPPQRDCPASQPANSSAHNNPQRPQNAVNDEVQEDHHAKTREEHNKPADSTTAISQANNTAALNVVFPRHHHAQQPSTSARNQPVLSTAGIAAVGASQQQPPLSTNNQPLHLHPALIIEDAAAAPSENNVQQSAHLDQQPLSGNKIAVDDKPTDSYSSAAHGSPHNEREHNEREEAAPSQAGRAGDAMAAASLVSRHAGDDDEAQHPHNAPVNNPSTLLNNPPSTPIAPVLQAGNSTTVIGPSLVPRVSAGLLAPPPGMTAQQLQNVVSVALARAPRHAGAARPGDSSSSGNRPLVLVGLKRKSGSGRPPMAPPAQVPRMGGERGGTQGTTAGNAVGNTIGNTAQNGGQGNVGAGETTLTVEDAVSMVDHGLEAELEVACDAVSRRSGEDEEEGEENSEGNGGGVGEEHGGGVQSRCPSVAVLSRASGDN